jgi:hypothetical protein
LTCCRDLDGPAEVIPLTFLTVEAWSFLQLGAAQESRSQTQFSHRWADMFLVAVGFWNFLGAGRRDQLSCVPRPSSTVRFRSSGDWAPESSGTTEIPRGAAPPGRPDSYQGVTIMLGVVASFAWLVHPGGARKPTVSYARARGRVGRLPQLVTAAVLTAWVSLSLPAAANAANVVNYTFHNPAAVMDNPCAPGDVVNLNGNLHVVISTTSNGNGGYHVDNHLNSHLRGYSITTGLKYSNSETNDEDWNAQPPFEAVHTHTYNFELNSSTGQDNYILKIEMHETVTANGTPTAVVDNYRMECRG